MNPEKVHVLERVTCPLESPDNINAIEDCGWTYVDIFSDGSTNIVTNVKPTEKEIQAAFDRIIESREQGV
jgi:hypothetical protein